MELKKLEFPSEVYLKDLIEKKQDGIAVRCGTVILKKGEKLPYKTLDYDEIAYLFSGKLLVYTKAGLKTEMNPGDLIYLHKDEIRETVTLEDSKLLFFLYKANL